MGLLRLISAAKSGSIFFRTSRKAINDFRSSTTCTRSVSSSSPWLMLPPEEGGRVFPFYSVADKKVFSFKNTCSSSMLRNVNECEFVGSSHGWLALYDPYKYDVFLFNPLTSRSIELPSVTTIFTPTERTRPWVYKLIITCPPESQGCRAVMLYGIRNSLAYCTPGSSTRWMGPIDPHFTPRPGDWGSWGSYGDFVHYSNPRDLYPMNNLLICIGDGLEAWNIHSKDKVFRPNRLVYQNRHLLYEEYHRTKVYPQGDYFITSKKHLVEYNTQIYLVFRDVGYKMGKIYDDFPWKTFGFRVFKIGRSGILGEKEVSLNGLAMFVGRNHSFALRAADYPGLMPNSIYFTQHWSSLLPRDNEDDAFGGHDIGVFDYENNTISPCHYPCDEDSYKRIVPHPLWFTPNPSDF